MKPLFAFILTGSIWWLMASQGLQSNTLIIASDKMKTNNRIRLMELTRLPVIFTKIPTEIQSIHHSFANTIFNSDSTTGLHSTNHTTAEM